MFDGDVYKGVVYAHAFKCTFHFCSVCMPVECVYASGMLVCLRSFHVYGVYGILMGVSVWLLDVCKRVSISVEFVHISGYVW